VSAKSILFNNTVLRDGHQSMAATRMTTQQMLPAAPILDESGKVTAAISISGPITRIGRERLRALAVAVRKGARQISAGINQRH